MRSKLCLIMAITMFSGTCLADNDQADIVLPPMETVYIEPVSIENISIWVPAAKSGPFINRSCRARENLSVSSDLPTSVRHDKTETCPPRIARILAELTALYYSRSLPLTIFNGWQWEYTYSLCQFESVTYNLAQRGGCWENCWEAIMNLSCGSIRLQWLEIESLDRFCVKHSDMPSESTIALKTFSSMRTRDGYPKEKQL